MSAFRDAVRANAEVALRCPKCGAANRPGVTYIEGDHTSERAYCTVCACEGPIAAFHPEPR